MFQVYQLELVHMYMVLKYLIPPTHICLPATRLYILLTSPIITGRGCVGRISQVGRIESAGLRSVAIS